MIFNDISEKLKFILVPDECIKNIRKDFYLPNALQYKYEINSKIYDLRDQYTNVEYLLLHPDLLDLIVNTFEKKVVNPEKYKQKPIVMAETTKKSSTPKNSTFDKMKDKFKSIYLPEVENEMSITFDGVICVKSGEEYVGFNKENQLVSYPEEMKMDIPMYSMLKPISQIKEGDIIKANGTFYKVTSIRKAEEGQIGVISFNGTKHYLKEIKDFMINQSFFRVVISFTDMNLFGNQNDENIEDSSNIFGNMNPNMMAMMYMQNKDSDSNDFFKMMMISQMMSKGSGNNMFGNMNPGMVMMCTQDKDKNSDSNDFMKMMMMSQIFQQNNK